MPSSSSLWESPNGNDSFGSNDSSDDWTLAQDWALLDNIPKFTVGEGPATVTFWSQLWTCTPQLCMKRSETELQQRYQTLLAKANNEESDNNNNNKIPPAGPSPAVLEQWSVNVDGRMSGELNGRTVWFVTQLMGRLEGDPASTTVASVAETTRIGIGDKGSPPVVTPQAGGFAEAVGGRVYELGRPKESAVSLVSTSVLSSPQTTIDDSEALFPFELPKLFPNFPFVRSTTLVLSALVASSILSIAIGYGAGLSVLRDNALSSSSSSSPTMTMQKTPSVTSQTTAVRKSGSAVTTSSYVYSYKTQISTGSPDMTLEERKARAKVRVLQDERSIKTVQERMAMNEQDFDRLLRQEKETGGQDLSVTERRAQAEARLTRNKRQLQSMETNFERDKAVLELLQQEQGGGGGK